MCNETDRRYATCGDVDEALYTDMLMCNFMSPRQRNLHMTIIAFLVLACILMMIIVGSFDWRMCLRIVLLTALEFMLLWPKKKARLSFQEVARDGKLR